MCSSIKTFVCFALVHFTVAVCKDVPLNVMSRRLVSEKVSTKLPLGLIMQINSSSILKEHENVFVDKSKSKIFRGETLAYVTPVAIACHLLSAAVERQRIRHCKDLCLEIFLRVPRLVICSHLRLLNA